MIAVPSRSVAQRVLPAAWMPLAVVFAVACWFAAVHGPRQADAARERWRAQLSAAADDRAAALDRWLRDGLATAQTVGRYPTVQSVLSDSDAPRREGVGGLDHAQELLAGAIGADRYRAATIFDRAGRVRVRVARSPGLEGDAVRRVALATLASAAPRAEVVRSGSPERVAVLLAAPVPGERRTDEAAGSVVLEDDPGDFLFPFLAAVSASTRTAESMLAIRVGDDALFLSPLRHHPAPPCTLRLPLTRPDFAMADALAGRAHFRIADDYRGTRVLAATRALTSAPWGLVVKIDEVEALEPTRELSRWQGASLLLALAALASSALALLHAHRARHAAEIGRARGRMAELLQHTRDAILFVGTDGQIQGANQSAVAFYGRRSEELAGSRLKDLQPTAAPSAAEADEPPSPGAVYEAVHARADGSAVPVEISLGLADATRGTLVAIVRDISARRAAEGRIRALNRLYRTLSEANQAIVRASGEQQLYDGVCQALVQHGDFASAWLGLRRSDGEVEPVARAGLAGASPGGAAERWDEATDPSAPAAIAIGERRVVAGGSAAFPIAADGAVLGALAVQAGVAATFAAEELDLLEELAGDVGNALHGLRARQRLQETEQKLTALFESEATGILFGDVDGSILDANDEFLRIVGYGREELRAGRLRWDALTPPEWLPLDARRIADARKRGACAPYEKEYLRKDGSRVAVLVGYVLLEPDRTRSVAFVLDISEQKAAQAAVWASEERLRLFFEHAPAALAMLDREMRYLQVSSRWMTDYGLGQRDLHGLSHYDVFPEIPERWRAVHRRALGGEVVRAESDRFDRADGSTQWLRWEVRPWRDASGAIGGIVVLTEDITQRRRAEAEARESAQRLRSLGDNLPDAYVYQYLRERDGTSRFLYVSEGVTRVHGIAVHRLLAAPETLYGLIDPLQRPALTAAELDSAASLADLGIELRIRGRDAGWRWVRIHSRPRRLAEGAVLWDGVATDITALKEAELALRRERDFSDAVLDSMPGVLYCYDQQLRFVRWNRNFERVTGYSATDVSRMSPLDFFAPDQREQVGERIQQAFARGNSELEADFLSRDGTSTPYYFTGRATVIDARPHLVGVGIDITDRRRAEREVQALNSQLEDRVRQRTAQLEAANRELEGFSYSVSHDLRAPLRAIDGFARILGEEHSAALSHEGRRVLGVVRDSVTRMGKLIDDLLAFSRAARMELRRTRVDMNQLVQSAFRDVAGDDAERLELQVERLESALGDPALLKQVWVNLLSNAVKFTRPRRRPSIEVSSRREGRRVVYLVQDNGVGFDQRYRAKLFGVFERLHSGNEFEGSGVGLALVERIVTRHGGGVTAEARPGEGAAFGFWLPDQDASNEASEG